MRMESEREWKGGMTDPRVGVALGGGAARGIAHIQVLEALDDLGVKPCCIAGTSIGALMGAAYASGIPARDIREHTLRVLGRPRDAARHIRESDRGLLSLLNFSLSRPVTLDGMALVEMAMPEGVAARVEETKIPLMLTTTDFYAASEMLIRTGDMRAAVAASIAIPGVIAAPRLKGRVHIDGAMTNPVPFDHVRAAGAEIVLAVEVTGKPEQNGEKRKPALAELAIGSTQIMQLQIAALKRRLDPPDIWLRPPLHGFKAYDFFKAREILQAAAPLREEAKRELEKALEG